MKKYCFFVASVVIGAALLFVQCTGDEELNEQSGTLVLKITDAASDDENIKGIFITVADIKLDGKPIRNFEPQTIEISDLKNGRTQLLINKELAAKPYEQISLVLAADIDTKGTGPGCHVLTTNNILHNLFFDIKNTSYMEVHALNPFELTPAKENNLVIDFNLRKAIVRTGAGDNKYRFVTPQEFENAIRIVNEERSGTISGEVKAKITGNHKIYILVYRQDSFQASIEGTGQGKSMVLFANSVTSTLVNPDGTYNIPFVEEGDYQIKIASFKKNKHNQFVFNGFLKTTSKKTGMLLNQISVTAGSETKLNIEVFTLF